MNTVQLWISLIGTPERAKKLRARIDSLESPPLDPLFGPEPIQCPTTVLFGAEVSRLLYTDPEYRPALDAWDTGAVSKSDIRRWCLYVEKGGSAPVTFYPDASWRAYLQSVQRLNASRAALLKQNPDRPTWESPKLISHERQLALRGTVDRKRRALKFKPIDWSALDD